MAVKIRDKLLPYLVYPDSDGPEYRAYCPLCEDVHTSKSPSCSVNFDTGLYYCQSCGQGGTLRQLTRAARINGTKPPVAKAKPNGVKREVAASEVKALPGPQTVKQWHQQLMMRQQTLKWLRDERGITVETLKKYSIGYDNGRITIPVYDIDGELVNVRRYKPNAKGSDKMISWGPGHGSGRILNPKELAGYTEVVLCEGEMDYLVAKQHKLPAATHTSGAGHFKVQWGPAFKDKIVYIAYDEDEQGHKGANKVASMLRGHARAVYRVILGTDIKSGDVTDYFVKTGGDHDSFMMLMQEATLLWEKKEKSKVPTKGKVVSVEESQNVELADQALEMNVMVIGKQSPAFLAPKKIDASCDQNAGNVCALCPMAVAGGRADIAIEPNDERLLSFINATDGQKHELYRKMVGAKCQKNVEFDVQDGYNIEELVVSPSIDHRTEDTETPISRKVYNIGTYKTPVNNTVRIVGKQVPDPATQRGTFMGWDLELLAQDIDEFSMTPQIREQLLKFQPSEGQAVLDKCMEIAEDMSANVTKIYGRGIMHIAMDLVWHSVISFDFDGHNVRKGWLEALIIGDTRTGKSEAATALRQHYGAGAVRSCESATFAGLVGGATQMPGGRSGWIVTWGTLPLNDRRLVVLDEMSGLMANKESHILGDMSSVRSEGRAEITKIVSEVTSARTRILWLSNPSTGERLSASPGSALQAIQGLIRTPEDIARFDYAMAVTNTEVPSSIINSSLHSPVPHLYDSDSCHNLITWCWSRKAEHVVWGAGAEEQVLKSAEKMGSNYYPEPPLIQVENVRIKLSRLAVAFAARTFSTDETGEKVVVRKAHVLAAVRFLHNIYSSPAMSYVQKSRRMITDMKLAIANKEQMKERLRSNQAVLQMVLQLGGKTFRPRDIEDSGINREEANQIVADMIDLKQIMNAGTGRYRAQSTLIEVAHEIESEQYESS